MVIILTVLLSDEEGSSGSGVRLEALAPAKHNTIAPGKMATKAIA